MNINYEKEVTKEKEDYQEKSKETDYKKNFKKNSQEGGEKVGKKGKCQGEASVSREKGSKEKDNSAAKKENRSVVWSGRKHDRGGRKRFSH
jgi:hypothetical protein